MEMSRVHVVVSGLVQAVGFRWSTLKEAQRRGLTGWVRNLPDGRVEAEVQGPPHAVRALVEHMATGPPSARVAGVETRDLEPVPAEEGFTAR